MRYSEDKSIRILASDHDELRHMSIDMGIQIKKLLGKLIDSFRDTADPDSTYMARRARAKNQSSKKNETNQERKSSLPKELQKILYQ